MKIYERELPQKQYHWKTSREFTVPRDHKPSPGDRYIGRWETWVIDKVQYRKGELLLYCTKTWNKRIETNERYVSCKKGQICGDEK